MPRAAPLKSNFNGGEWSALLDGRADLEGYESALGQCENFIPLVQGGLTKRPGTKFVNDPTAAATAKPGILIPFEFSTEQAYMLAFIDGTCHIYTSAKAKVATTFAIPYANADLPLIRWAQSADQLYLTCPGYQPRIITRAGPTTWSIAPFVAENGPFLPLNTNDGITVYADAQTGEVTLTATGPMFTTGHVGGLFYIEPQQFAAVKPWVEGERGLTVGDVRRSDGKTYSVASVPTAPTGGYVATGPAAPTHTYGKAFDGPQDSRVDENADPYIVGVEWQYINSGYGIVQITAFTSATSVDGNVLVTLPAEVVGGPGTPAASFGPTAGNGDTMFALGTGFTSLTPSDYQVLIDGIGSPSGNWYLTAGPTLNFYSPFDNALEPRILTVNQLASDPDDANFTSLWAFGAWSNQYGWPESVTFYDDRLCFANTPAQPNTVWRSEVGDYPNFGVSTPRVASDSDDFTLASRQVNAIRWMQDDERGLLLGTTGGEWILRPLDGREALTVLNADAKRASTVGAAPGAPHRIDSATLFVARDTRTLTEIAFTFESDSYKKYDLSLFNTLITRAGVKQIVYQEHPQSIIWLVLDDGSLVAFTYNREQGVLAWHRHTLGGDATVVSAGVLPGATNEEDDLWLYVQRTINGGVRNYIEFLTPIFGEGAELTSAFFVDCGLSYSGAATDTLTGLAHLEGKTVKVFANGSVHPDAVVSGGEITLESEVTTASVGLAYTAKARTLRIEAGAADGTAQGKIKRLSQVVFRLLETLDLQYNDGQGGSLERVEFDHTALFSGDKVEPWPGGYDREGYIYIESSLPLPCTVTALMPRVSTQDGG